DVVLVTKTRLPQKPIPSSTCPSQSLSIVSQTSAPGAWFRLQASAPLVHAVVPAAHTPACPVLQLTPPPGFPSSTWPSQSLSSPSQISAPGCWFRLQATAPLEHAVVPAAHTPG